MSTLEAPSRTTARPPDPRRFVPSVLCAASVLLAGLASLWVADPSANPFRHSEGHPSLVGLLSASTSAWLLVVLGLLGGVTAVVLATGRPVGLGRSVAVAVTALEALVLGLVVPDLELVAILGYLVALCVPLLVVGLLVAACRTSVRWRWITGVLAVGVVWWGTATTTIDPGHLAELGRELGSGFAGLGARPLYLLGAGVLGLLWGLVLIDLLGRDVVDRRVAPVTIERWTRTATVVAACGPLPYVLVRATWLTPWPFVGIGPSLDLSPEIRLWGLLLGAAALGGSVLTLGLIRPWGTVFPRWVPIIAGRRVPISVAAVPGATVAYVVTVGAAPLLLGAAPGMSGRGEWLLLTLVMPFWLWGPALGIATWGYVRRRQLDASVTA